jgi:hypothetical protein
MFDRVNAVERAAMNDNQPSVRAFCRDYPCLAAKGDGSTGQYA